VGARQASDLTLWIFGKSKNGTKERKYETLISAIKNGTILNMVPSVFPHADSQLHSDW
jgi:hypothetical protein